MPKRCGGFCSTSCTASRICNRRRSGGSAEASHRQPCSWRCARAHRAVPKRCSVFGTVCLSRVIGPSVTSCLSSSRNIGSTSSTKVVQVPCRSSHDAGAITICGGTGGSIACLRGGRPSQHAGGRELAQVIDGQLLNDQPASACATMLQTPRDRHLRQYTFHPNKAQGGRTWQQRK